MMMLGTHTVATLVMVGLPIIAVALANGASGPLHDAIERLQHGATPDRRQAAELLAQIGTQQAVQPLTQALRDNDVLVRQAAEQALWRIWHRSGNATVDRRLQDGIMAMQQGDLQQAVDIFTEVIGMAPDFAEGYNKRATVLYMMQDYERSIADCEKTIALNPVHFGALSGTGLNYLGLRNLVKALAYFERADDVNPNMPQIQSYIEAIKKYLRDETL